MTKKRIGGIALAALSVLFAALGVCTLQKTEARAEETYHFDYNFVKDGAVDGLNFTVENDAENHVSSNASGIKIQNEHGRGTGARVAGAYSFEEGANDTLFDVTFTGHYGGAQTRWVEFYAGLAFGLPSPQADFSEGNFVGIGTLHTSFFEKGEQHPFVLERDNYCNFAEAFNERVTLRVVGRKNGKVDLYRGYTMNDPNDGYNPKTENIDELFCSYTVENVGGYIALGIFNATDFSGDYSFTFTDFLARGNIGEESPRVRVDIEEKEFAYAYVGMPAIPLKSAVCVAPAGMGYSNAVTYSVVSGNASVENGMLSITGAGEITLRATSVADPQTADEVTFTPKEKGAYEIEPYRVEDGFSSYDEGIWELNDPYKRATFGRGFTINADCTDGTYLGAKAVSRVRFSSLGTAQVVFDMSVRAFGFYRYNYVDRWGFAFGLPERDTAITDAGVGFLWMSQIGMGLMLGGREYLPDYVCPYNTGSVVRYLDSAVYADTYNEAFIIRLIAYKDGTLELYRTQAGHENLGELKARWTGLDFNGYVALSSYSDYVNAETLAKSGASFREFSIAGMALDDGKAEITALSIDKDIFIDVAQVEPPLTLAAFVSVAPSFEKYKKVDWEVVSGDASITDGKITFGAPGMVTIRAKAHENAAKQEEYTFSVGEFTVNAVRVDKTYFQNVTDFTQPIELEKAAELESSLPTPKYNIIDWEVVSGPARVQGGRLRILGTGNVTVRAVARYDQSKMQEITFRVRAYWNEGVPVLAIVLPVVGVVLAAGAAVTAVLAVRAKKRKANTEKTDEK